MSLPDRFSSKITKTKGKVEAEVFISNHYQVDTDALLKSYIDYASVIVDKPTLESVIFHTENTIKSFDGKFSINFDTYPSVIQKFINLYVDKETGYVTYNTQDDNGDDVSHEIRISDGVFHKDNTLKNVGGDTLLDIDTLNSDIKELKDRDIKYDDSDSDNKKIEDADGNEIINVNTLNSDIKELKDRDIKYDSDNKLIEDANGNELVDIEKVKNKLVIGEVVVDDSSNTTLNIITDDLDSEPKVSMENSEVKITFDKQVIPYKEIRAIFTIYNTKDSTPLVVNHGDYTVDTNNYLKDLKIRVFKSDGTLADKDYKVTFHINGVYG